MKIPRRLISSLLKAKSFANALIIVSFALIAILVANSNFVNLKSFNTIEGKVVKVIDGDTIDILDSNKNSHRIRFHGIDAPEKKQAYGNKSREFLASLIAGKQVKVLVKDKDRYQRIVGVIKLEGEDINKNMVVNGYAWAYEEYSKDYVSEQGFAREFKLGLWADKNPIKPSEFRKSKR